MGLELLHATLAPIVGGLTGIRQTTSFKTIISDYTSSKFNLMVLKGEEALPPFWSIYFLVLFISCWRFCTICLQWKLIGHFCDTDLLWPLLLFFFYLKRLLFAHYWRLFLLGIGFCGRFFCCCFSTLKMLLPMYWVRKSLVVYRSNWQGEPRPKIEVV